MVYNDGIIHVTYTLAVDQIVPSVNVTLFGLLNENLIVVDENNTLLVYSIYAPTTHSRAVDVYSLGARSIRLDWDALDLTNKTSGIWVMMIDAPINFTVTFPKNTRILDLSAVPLEITVKDQQAILTMPPNLQTISYIVGAITTNEKARGTLDTVAAIIANIKAGEVNTAVAEALLQTAETAFSAGNYTGAEQLANDALELAYDLQEEKARETLDTVAAIIANIKAGEVNTAVAEALLLIAETAFSAGNYTGAEQLANDALELAYDLQDQAQSFPTPLLLLVSGSAISAALSLFLVRRVRGGKIDVEAVLREYPWLRSDQREVIRFLAEKRDGIFESDLRNAFDLPKSTMWRLIKRLEDEEIVTVSQLRGQNYIELKKRKR
ncbi:MAG: hypothetical protein NWF13_07265 [Candidatus Bathyarchaeota archaeon]|nr:hypothetical protein [Candidatus Bathyarchaeota archaeon]